ncbi:oxidative stress survival, Svf1-like protein [Gorgonomyces haynaldii]|nr:oxidative stress survival, Svf1-like protein [Gorgonomyces haynaldii]
MSAVAPKSYEWVLESSGTNQGVVFYVTSNSGYFFQLQIVYSSINSWSPSAQIIVRIYGLDGFKYCATKNVSGSALKISQDKVSVSLEGCNINKTATGYTFVYKNDEVDIDLVFNGQEGFQVGPGEFQLKKDKQGGWIRSHFLPRLETSGKAVIKGKQIDPQGPCSVVYAHQNQPQNIARWNFATVHSQDVSVLIYQFETPKDPSYTLQRQVQAAVVRGGKLLAILTSNQTAYKDSAVDSFSGYKIPNSISHELTGQTLDGKPVSVKLDFTLQNLADKVDILGELPFLLRKIIQALFTKPFAYQWFSEVQGQLTVDGQTQAFSAKYFQEIVLMEELE